MSSTTIERSLAFVALMGAVCWPLELLWPRRAPRFTPRTWLADLGWLVLGAFTLTWLVGPLLRAVPVTPSPTPLKLVLAFIGAEVMAYASHRAMHEVPWLWRFHAVHHGPRELDWLKAWRQHPIDVAIHALCVGLPGVLLGAPLSGLAGFLLVRRLWTALLHANTRMTLGPLENVIVSPDFHHLHHARGGVNYAGLFPWLDRLFGTAAFHPRPLAGVRSTWRDASRPAGRRDDRCRAHHAAARRDHAEE